MTGERVNLGDRAKDRVTGFTGIVIGRTTWLTGCDHLLLQPETLHDGSPIDPRGFDEPAVALVARGIHADIAPLPAPAPVAAPRTGGPRPVVRGGR